MKVLGLLGLMLVLYLPLTKAPFVYEDANWVPYLEASNDIQWLGAIPSRHLTYLTYRWQSDDQTPKPQPFHVFNLGVHLLNGVLIAVIAWQLGLPWFLAVAIWWLHPLQVQAVAYVSARTDLLMTFGVLVALACALSRSTVALVGVVAGLAVAAMSKELGLIGAVLVLLTVIWQRRWGVALLLASLACMAFAVGLPRILMALQWPPNIRGVWESWVQFGSFLRTVGLMIVPVGLSFDPDPISYSNAVRIAGLVALGFLASLAWCCRTIYPAVPWASAWIAVALLPRVLVPNGEPIHDHHAYLAMVGMCLAMSSVITPLLSRTLYAEE